MPLKCVLDKVWVRYSVRKVTKGLINGNLTDIDVRILCRKNNFLWHIKTTSHHQPQTR